MTTTMTRPRGVGQRTAHDPGDPLVTSHCPFCGSGQVVGRSDGTIGCDFCGQNYIVRVQPAFPGMPQMPMGPGAPSDVGPDGGLVDPGMIGPDGAPMDDGPPPGEDAEPGGGPLDDATGDEAGGPPPPAGGSGDDDTDSGPPAKKKSGKGGNKKESARIRRYLGLEGQRLTEEQFIRHIAVRASGASPRVMAVLRAESRRRVTADSGPRPYRTLSSGHQVSIGHSGDGWYGMISPPAPYSQVHLMDLGQAGSGKDAAMAAEQHLARGPARDFVRATSGDWPSGLGLSGERPRLVDTNRHSEWYRGPGTGGAPQEWRAAQASRRRRPFTARATRTGS